MVKKRKALSFIINLLIALIISIISFIILGLVSFDLSRQDIYDFMESRIVWAQNKENNILVFITEADRENPERWGAIRTRDVIHIFIKSPFLPRYMLHAQWPYTEGNTRDSPPASSFWHRYAISIYGESFEEGLQIHIVRTGIRKGVVFWFLFTFFIYVFCVDYIKKIYGKPKAKPKSSMQQ